MAVWVSGTIVDDEGEFFFRTDRGDLFRINAQVEASYRARSGTPPLLDGLQLEADVNDRVGKVENLRVPAISSVTALDNFHNPYNFIPAPPFKPDPVPAHAASGPPAKGLEQGPPEGHHRWHDDRYSGRIHIEIAAVTPLLIPDADPDPHPEAADRDHKIFRTLADGDGKPVMPVTSLKGALRSAYEAITNSRMGVMDRRKVSYRDQQEGRRKEHPLLPRDLLDQSLRPASGLTELSPADRVFGWAHESGHGAFRGQLRIAPVRFVSGKGVTPFETPLPLAIMGEPKPAQWLFYGAEDQTGKPLSKREEAGAEGYQKGKGIRGRKTYPHQNVPAARVPLAVATAAYWNQTKALENAKQEISVQTKADKTTTMSPDPAVVEGTRVYREYVRMINSDKTVDKAGNHVANPNCDNQNRSIRDWVEPGSTFSTSIDVINLSREELGALLWLLDVNAAEGPIDKRRYHLKLGGGKPLGFGSVAVRISGAEIWSGAAKAKALADFIGKPETLSEAERQALVSEYRSWMALRYGGEFVSIPFIAGFLQSAAGYHDGLPTHYPRLSQAPDPAGENFRWFVANMRGEKQPLPGIVQDPGLPRRP